MCARTDRAVPFGTQIPAGQNALLLEVRDVCASVRDVSRVVATNERTGRAVRRSHSNTSAASVARAHND
jgi:hypothetical protein